MRPRGGLAAALIALAGCGAGPSMEPSQPAAVEPVVALDAGAADAAADHEAVLAAAGRRRVADMVVRVSRARGLPVKGEVPSRVLDRAGILARIRAHVEKDIPLDVVATQGEVLAALELVPPEYDFVEGAFQLIQGRIAGYYEPEDRTMYMVDDLDEQEATETLAHELVHALQDQSYPLAPMVKFVPGDSDRISAAHALIEGDATSAMLDVVAGSAFNVSEGALRQLLALSNAVSKEGSAAPKVMQSSLAAPYADGFAFVQGRRTKGGWPEVDAAWRALPETTEQLLHQDKYEAREPAIRVDPPTFAALGAGFTAAIDDVMGEQGLRLMFEEWTYGATATEAAAGWGGDRYVVARRDEGGQRAVAIGWRTVLDTPKDAAEMAAILKQRFGGACRERKALGPIAWRRRGNDVVVAAGPFVREAHGTKGAGACATATRWVDEMLKQAPKAPAKQASKAPAKRAQKPPAKDAQKQGGKR